MDILTPEKRSERMKAIGPKDTKPEMTVRRFLHRQGFRYILHDKRLPGRPDIVLPKYRTAIQVRGCFWHLHDCSIGHIPKSKASYWARKLRANKERDEKNDKELRKLGWNLIVVWECECAKKQRLEATQKRIVDRLTNRFPEGH